MLVRDIMSSPAITVTTDTHIPEVARMLRAHQISGMPVLDAAGRLVGIVTDHDLILRNAPVDNYAVATFYEALHIGPLAAGRPILILEPLNQIGRAHV